MLTVSTFQGRRCAQQKIQGITNGIPSHVATKCAIRVSFFFLLRPCIIHTTVSVTFTNTQRSLKRTPRGEIVSYQMKKQNGQERGRCPFFQLAHFVFQCRRALVYLAHRRTPRSTWSRSNRCIGKEFHRQRRAFCGEGLRFIYVFIYPSGHTEEWGGKKQSLKPGTLFLFSDELIPP